MFSRIVLLFTAIVCMAGGAFAQSQPCSTDEHYHSLLLRYPQLAEYEKQFTAQLEYAKTTATVDTNTYDVPLVVHIVHDYGTENIPDDVIYDAAAYWAVVYRAANADTIGVIDPFKQYVGDSKIRLHLATIDPNGNPTKGVVRHFSYLTTQGDDITKFEPWPNNKYINIWFINTFSSEHAGAAAYAYYPSSGAFMPYYDGVISLASYINTSKTVPHELGHVLNLQHVWGNTNNPAVACGNDQVDDTPPTKGHNPGCTAAALYDTACATGYAKMYTSSHSSTPDSLANYPDTVNSQNIMDYTYCSLMFTKGQCARMRTALTGSTAGRNNLITPANLAATGALAPMPDLAPVADFIMNKASGAGGITDARTYFLSTGSAGSFVFRNTSWNDTLSDVSWTFSNGATNPTSTSMANVTNKFTTPGWVTVSLTANSNAGSNTITNSQAVYAADPTAVGGLGYSQAFSNVSDISNWPMVNFYRNQYKWDYYTGAGIGDNSCIRYRSYDTSNKRTGTQVGDYDDFYTPAFDLEGATGNVYFNFFTSGAYTNAIPSGATAVFDKVEVDVTINGGAVWTKLAEFTGTDLGNTGALSSEYVATSSSQWVPRSVSVASTYRKASTFFRFRFKPGNKGDNVYIDNVGISGFQAGVMDAFNSSNNSFSVFPNPSANGCNLVFRTGNDGVVHYSIKDITGKVVYTATKTLAPNSVQQEAISRAATPAAGMYFVTITIDGVNATQKMVVY